MKYFSGLLLLLLFVTPIRIFSQGEYLAGFIINSHNDTIYGYIGQSDYLKSAKECYFKSTLTFEPVKYEPENLKAYHYTDGKLFVSRVIPLNGDSTSVFLECLIDGIADIYYLKEASASHFYIEKAGLGIQELFPREEKTERRVVGNSIGYPNDKTVVLVKDKYKAILHVAFGDDRKLYNKIDHTPLSARALVNIS